MRQGALRQIGSSGVFLIRHRNETRHALGIAGFLAGRFHFDANGVHMPAFGAQVGAQGGQCLAQFGRDRAVGHQQAPGVVFYATRLHQ